MGAVANLLRTIKESATSAGYSIVIDDSSAITEGALPPDSIFVRDEGGAVFNITIEQVL